MSVLLLIDYEWDVDWSTAVFPAEKDAIPFSTLPGLQWKIWIRDAGTRRRGGFYLFSDRATAEAFLASAIVRLRERSGDIHARILDLDETTSRITRGPLDIAHAVAPGASAG